MPKKTKARTSAAHGQVTVKKLDLNDPDARIAFEEIRSNVVRKFKSVTEPIRDSQRLSKDDFAIRINARG